MKRKPILLLAAMIAFSNPLLSKKPTSATDRLFLETSGNILATKNKNAFAPLLGFGYSTYDLDFALIGRLYLYEINEIKSRELAQLMLRVNGKYHLPFMPLTAFLGLGVGYTYGLRLRSPAVSPTTGLLEDFKAGSVALEFSGGGMYPLTQKIMAIVHLGYQTNNFYHSPSKLNVSMSGFTFEIGVRLYRGNTVHLRY